LRTTDTGLISQRAITVTARTNTKAYDGNTSAAAVPTITSGSLASGDTAAFSETYDTKAVGTGKTLTPSGSVNDGNGGANYAVTFATNTTGAITGTLNQVYVVNLFSLLLGRAPDTSFQGWTSSTRALPQPRSSRPSRPVPSSRPTS
jgi:hypothetical protein